MVAFGSGGAAPPTTSGVPSSKQKFRERSVYVRLQEGQRFICRFNNCLSVSEQNHLSYVI